MRIGVPMERYAGERRVATTPEVVTQLTKLGFDVAIETGAGAAASFNDDAYEDAGATILADAEALWTSSDIILKVRAPQESSEPCDLAARCAGLTLGLWPLPSSAGAGIGFRLSGFST